MGRDLCTMWHDDVIKWKDFPRYWPFVWGIHRSLVNSPNKSQCHRALIFYLICAWINGSVNNRETGEFRRYRAHYNVTVMHLWVFRLTCTDQSCIFSLGPLVPKGPIDYKSALAQTMAISHYLNQWLPGLRVVVCHSWLHRQAFWSEVHGDRRIPTWIPKYLYYLPRTPLNNMV